MIEKKTLIDQIEVTRTGRLQVRFVLRVEENGAVLGEPKYHRTAIDPGGDPAAVFDAEDAAITAGLAWAPIERGDGMFTCLQAMRNLLHTPDVVKRFQDAQVAASAV